MRNLIIDTPTASLVVDAVTTTRVTKGAELFVRWRASDGGLFDKYSSPSEKKLEAFEEIKEEMRTVGGRDLRVTGGNSYRFSCAYRVVDKDGRDWLICHSKSKIVAVAY